MSGCSWGYLFPGLGETALNVCSSALIRPSGHSRFGMPDKSDTLIWGAPGRAGPLPGDPLIWAIPIIWGGVLSLTGRKQFCAETGAGVSSSRHFLSAQKSDGAATEPVFPR